MITRYRKNLVRFIVALFCATLAQAADLVIPKHPVVDLYYKPLSAYGEVWKNHEIPVSCVESTDCPRNSQMLANEIGYFTGIEIDGFCWICMPNYFITLDNKSVYFKADEPAFSTHFNRFWVKKSDVVIIPGASKPSFDLGTIPTPLDYRDKQSFERTDIVALTCPWHDTATNWTFSAGTRFIRVEGRDSATTFGALFTNPESGRTFELTIPKNCAVVPGLLSREDRLELFKKLMHTWANPTDGIIPFVWGGKSFTQTIRDSSYTTETIDNGDSKQVVCWKRPQGTTPHSGFDMPGAVLLAAQICGIPFGARTTSAVEHSLKPVRQNEAIEPGDLVYVPGGLFALIDQNGTLANATGYAPGWGKFHTMTIGQRFAHATTINDLRELHERKLPIYLKRKDGSIAELPALVIYKLRSAWR